MKHYKISNVDFLYDFVGIKCFFHTVSIQRSKELRWLTSSVIQNDVFFLTATQENEDEVTEKLIVVLSILKIQFQFDFFSVLGDL